MSRVKGMMLDAALSYAARGLAVFPLSPGTKVPLAGSRGFKDATTDLLQIDEWWTEDPTRNIGLATGRASGISVLDVDPKKGGNDTLFNLLIRHGAMLDGAKQTTWSGGSHYVFEYDPRAKQSVDCYGTGLDGRNDGGYIVAAPSVVNGKAYEWIIEPNALTLDPMPAWLLETGATVSPVIKRSDADWAAVAKGASKGSRQEELPRIVGKFYHSLEFGLARQAAQNWAASCEQDDGALTPEAVDKCCDRIEARELAKRPTVPVNGDAPKTVRWQRGRDLDDTPISYLVEDMIPDGMLGAIGGKDGRGKTLFGLEVARCVLTGNKLFGRFAVKQGKVFAMLLDDPEHLVRARLEQMGIVDHENLRVVTLKHVDMTDPAKLLGYLAEQLADQSPTFVLIDALYLFVPDTGNGDQANSAGAMRPVMAALDEIANRTGAVVAVVAHDNKAGGDIAGSRVVRQMLKWIIRVLLPQQFEDDPRGGVETPDRVLQLNKLKTGRPASWHLTLDGPGRWTFNGTAAEHRVTNLEARIVEHLTEAGYQTVKEIKRELGKKEEDVRRVCVALHQRGILGKDTRAAEGGHQGGGNKAVTYGLPTGPRMPWVKGT